MKNKCGILAGILLLCIASRVPAEDADSEKKLITITGLNWQELKACKADSECAEIPTFMGCCKNLYINKTHREIVEQKRNLLWQTLTTPEAAHNCSLVECLPHSEEPVCVRSQCTSKPFYFPATLTTPQVKKIADEAMVKGGMDANDFAPTIAYESSGRMWRVHYGTKLGTHEENMRKTGRDDVYDVEVDDQSRTARLDKSFIMDPKWTDPDCLIPLLCH